MTASDQQNELRTCLNQETARIAWAELLRHFAGGSVLLVSNELDLIDVALQIANDNKTAVAQWLAEQRIAPVTDAQAGSWLDAGLEVWSVVVRPWVLVQLEKGQRRIYDRPDHSLAGLPFAPSSVAYRRAAIRS
ncbi:DUF2288 domain-containing protein [Undibacterium arcticum]